MLTEVFYWLFSMSVVAGLTGLVVLLLRCVRGIPRRLICWLWCVPFLRMWIPVGIGSRFSFLLPLLHLGIRSVPAWDTTMVNCAAGAESYFPIVFKSEVLELIFRVSAGIWMTVAAGLLILLTALYISEKWAIRGAVWLRENIWLSDAQRVPMVYGVFRPKILLPTAYQDRDLTIVLLHEKAHIRRMDNFRRLVAFVTACIHWFNPLSWVFLRCFLTDLELACDETVLRRCGEDQRKAYASALVDGVESRNLLASCFGGGKLRRRVEGVLSWRKLSLFSSVCLAALAVVIAWALLSNPI